MARKRLESGCNTLKERGEQDRNYENIKTVSQYKDDTGDNRRGREQNLGIGKIKETSVDGSRKDIETEPDSLYGELVKYCGSDSYPCHMPGHKRNAEAGEMAQYYGIDITEIDGFDNLHHAEGILLEAQQRANRLYGNEKAETFYLINGSTCGVLASVMTVAERGGEILIARNCHKSVYHAVILQGLTIHYYEPPVLESYGICGGVSAEGMALVLEEYPNCSAVVITSPTYEGILSDVGAIAKVVHERDKILIVDEAHGAHLGLQGGEPHGALTQGADLVIHSLHKTLPAMTQTALLHVQGERADRGKLRRYLAMLQSSSPSYVLMASMDSCIRYLEKNGAARRAFMEQQYDLFCKKVEKCRFIEIGNIAYRKKTELEEKLRTGSDSEKYSIAEKQYCMSGWDIGKLLIHVKQEIMSGRQLYDLLRDEYHLQMEMAAERYALAIMTIMDTEEGWQRLADALLQIDGRIETEKSRLQSAWPVKATRQEAKETDVEEPCRKPQRKKAVSGKGYMTAEEAFLGEWEEVSLTEAVGRVAADFIHLYPPGIPLAVPGEPVSRELTAQIRRSVNTGLQVQGVSQEGKIAVVRNCGKIM